jgi:NifU-like protein
MWEYSEKLMEHFKNPRNVGEIENPDGVGEIGNIVCGDALRLTLRIDRKTDTITDARFKTFGCASAIASSSVLTEMVKGKTVEEASRITNREIADFLGGMPEEKLHCSVMGMEALEKAIANYRGEPVKKEMVGDEKVICKCFGVTDKKIIRAISENGLKTIEDVTNYTKAGGGCGKCWGEIQSLIDEYWAKKGHEKAGRERAERPSGKLTNLGRINLVQDTIEREVRPQLKADGGDIELVDIDRHKVYIRFLGRCLGCPSTGVTLKALVESKLKEFVEKEIEVEEVRS